MVAGVVQQTLTAEDNCQVCEALFGLLADAEDKGFVALDLVSGVVLLTVTEDDKRRAREMVLGLMGEIQTLGTAELSEEVVRLDPNAEDKHWAREVLLRLLTGQTDGWVAQTASG